LKIENFVRIIISQQDKKLIAEFHHGKIVDKYIIDKAEEFLGAVDRFIRKSRIKLKFFNKVRLEFHDTGILTERVIRAIILGLSFSQN